MIQERNYKEIDRMLSLDSTRQLNNILRKQLLGIRKNTPSKTGLVIFDNGEFNPLISSTSLIKILHETQDVNKVVFYTTRSPHSVQVLTKEQSYNQFYFVEDSVIHVNCYLHKTGSILNSKMRFHKTYTSWTAIGTNDGSMNLNLEHGSILLCS